ncbi:MAG TPA: hypothetical protein VL132_05445, partial [Planctomycetaceae bacterium]|nr:hypothetical protein [Planctomycetaceae bacterium]
ATGGLLGVRPRFDEEASDVRRTSSSVGRVDQAVPPTITTDVDVHRTGIARAGVNTCGRPNTDCTQ